MTNHMPLSAGVSNHRESTQVDKIGKYLEQVFNPYAEPNGIFLYDWKNNETGEGGAELFSHVINSPAYKAFTDKEIDLFAKNKHSIIKAFTEKKSRNIVDMGPGDGEKSAKILSETLGERVQGNTYIPVDISPYFMQHASAKVQHHLHEKHRTRVKTAGVAIDFLESNAGLKDLTDKIYFFLGGSIGNFSDNQIIEILRNMASDGKKKNNIVMSYFTAPDKEAADYPEQIQKMCATYGDPDKSNPFYNQGTHDAIKAWIMGGFASLGLDTNKLEFFVRYDERNTKMILGAKVKENLSVKHNGKIYAKEAGDELLAIQSKRFTPSKLLNLAEEANVEIKKTDSYEGIGMAIIESDRTYEAKEKRRNRKKWATRSALAGALLGIGIRGGTTIEKEKQMKQMKQNLENVLHNKLEPKDYKTDYYIHLTDEAKAALFTKKAIEFYDVLSERYDLNEISSEKKEFIKVLLFQWLINQDESVIDITTVTGAMGMGGYPNHTYEKITELLEIFIDQNEYALIANDVHLHLHSTLSTYENALQNTFECKDSIVITQWSTSSQAHSINNTRQNYEWIGPYTTTTGKDYLVGKYKKDGKEYIVGCEFMIVGDSYEEKQKWIENYKNGTLASQQKNPNLSTNNINLYPNLTSDIGKRIAEDYYTKPYFNKLAEKIVNTLKKDPEASQYDLATIISYMIYRSKEGYDFSWLTTTKNTDDILSFAHTYMPEFYRNDSSKYNKSKTIQTIVNIGVTKYLHNISENIKEDHHGKEKLESALFHRLCTKELLIHSTPYIQKWINENEDVFTPRIPQNTYPRINPEKPSILSSVQPYKKQHADDIKNDPGLINITLHTYEDLDGNQYEVGVYQGNVYARYVIPNESHFPLGTTPEFIKHLRDKIIQECKNEGLGIWSPEMMKRQQELIRSSAGGFVEQSKDMYEKNISDKLFSYNTEIGNIVLKDYRKRTQYGLGGNIAPH